MRSTAIQYVGIDVHQATLVCVVKDETQTTIESKVATRREAIGSFVRGLGGRVGEYPDAGAVHAASVFGGPAEIIATPFSARAANRPQHPAAIVSERRPENSVDFGDRLRDTPPPPLNIRAIIGRCLQAEKTEGSWGNVR